MCWALVNVLGCPSGEEELGEEEDEEEGFNDEMDLVMVRSHSAAARATPEHCARLSPALYAPCG